MNAVNCTLMKQFLASIFLLIFSLQIMPVKEIGKLLYKGVMTEERHEAECCGDDIGDLCGKAKHGNEPLMANTHGEWYHIFISIDDKFRNTLIPDNMCKQYIPDILTPPPNTI
jgi:hypothetical protein